jgi:hypothetical protein
VPKRLAPAGVHSHRQVCGKLGESLPQFELSRGAVASQRFASADQNKAACQASAHLSSWLTTCCREGRHYVQSYPRGRNPQEVGV